MTIAITPKSGGYSVPPVGGVLDSRRAAVGPLAIPAEGAFASQGTVLTPSAGTWYQRFPHGTPASVIKKNGEYIMYIIGADGDRPSDGGPANRALGFATASALSGPWTMESSPILTHQPNTDDEEGFWRDVAAVDDDGTVLQFGTVLTGSGGTVNGDVKLWTSSNGKTGWTDQGVVLDHSDTGVWGNGDELAALAFAKEGGVYHLWYVAKTSGAIDWDLGHAWGSSPTNIGQSGNSEAFLNESFLIGHGCSPLRRGDGSLLFFVGDNAGPIHVHTMADATAGPGAAVESWNTLIADQFEAYYEDGELFLFGAQGPNGDATGIELFTVVT